MDHPVHIVGLEVENFLKLKTVELDSLGQVVVVGGDNAQGKSSLLNSIEVALRGGKAVPEDPVHTGASKAKITTKFSNGLQVTREIAKDGSIKKFVFSDANGGSFDSPQTLLNKMVGELICDPMSFYHAKSSDRLAYLKQAIGLDLSDLDRQYKAAYDARSEANRIARASKTRLENAPDYIEAPDEEVNIAELMATVRDLDGRENTLKAVQNELVLKRQRAQRLQDELDKLRKDIEDDEESVLHMQHWLADKDLEGKRQMLTAAEKINAAVRHNQARKQLNEEAERDQAEAERLDREVNAIEALRKQRMIQAGMPLEGLDMTVDGVLYNGKPLEQASQAEQLKVAVAIGMAKNPEIRVILLRQGAYLDSTNLELMKQMAIEHGAQIWIERVGKEGANIVLEAGEVAA